MSGDSTRARLDRELAALLRWHGVDLHNDPDVHAAVSLLVQLAATQQERMLKRREQMERAMRENVPLRVIVEQDHAGEEIMRVVALRSLQPMTTEELRAQFRSEGGDES